MADPATLAANALWALRQGARLADTEIVAVELFGLAADGRKFGIGFDINTGSGVDRSCCVTDPNGARG